MSRLLSPMTAPEIARSYGLSARHWTRMAANGRIPGAYYRRFLSAAREKAR